MSGPKVVRIVTLEELLAICRGHLARLDAALQEWRRIGRRNETVSDAEIAAAEARRDALHRLLQQQEFLQLQKQVPIEIAFLQSDQHRRISAAAAATARERTVQRRTEAVASSVLSALERAGVTVPGELRRTLEAAANGRVDGTAAISQAFALLGAGNQSGVTEHQRKIASALKESDDRQSFSEWLAAQPVDDEDDGLARLELRLTELAATLGHEATEAFEQRLRRVAAETSVSRRLLLQDSLEVDLAQAVSRAREYMALQGRVKMLAAELAETGRDETRTTAQSLLADIDAPTERLVEMEREASALLGRVREEFAARSRRQAVLKGLAALGYEVTEGMETAWVREGRVVLKKAAQPGYGVEVGGGAGSARLQMRTVAFRNPADPADRARDQDAETIWCGDVATLQAQFAAAGGGIEIERALPVGATPVKVVADMSIGSQREVERSRAPHQEALD